MAWNQHRRLGIWTIQRYLDVRPRNLTAEELDIIRAAAAARPGAPAGIDLWTWLPRETNYWTPHATWLNAIHPFADIPLSHALPYPVPGTTAYGWVERLRLVVWRLYGPHEDLTPR
jgi:hypothetical protein